MRKLHIFLRYERLAMCSTIATGHFFLVSTQIGKDSFNSLHYLIWLGYNPYQIILTIQSYNDRIIYYLIVIFSDSQNL